MLQGEGLEVVISTSGWMSFEVEHTAMHRCQCVQQCVSPPPYVLLHIGFVFWLVMGFFSSNTYLFDFEQIIKTGLFIFPGPLHLPPPSSFSPPSSPSTGLTQQCPFNPT